jgi:hypothetical protein
MRESTLHKIAIVVVAVALGSAVIVTDAVAAGGHAVGGGGGGATAGGRFGGGFVGGRVEHGHYGRDRGRAVPSGTTPTGTMTITAIMVVSRSMVMAVSDGALFLSSPRSAQHTTALINLALGWSTLLQQGASGQSWLAIGWVVNRKRRTISWR